MIWLHVGQVCGSLYVIKLIMKAGSAGKEALTTVIGEIVDVEFVRKPMELVEVNEEYSGQCNHVRMRSKNFVKRAKKLNDLRRRLGLRATDISVYRLLLKLFSSGKLKSDVECATDIHLAFDRRQQDACGPS